jgi:hypothetical protein
VKRLFIILLAITVTAYGWDKPTMKPAAAEVARLKEKADKMKEEDRGHTYSELCLQLAEQVNEQYNDGEPDKAVASVQEIVAYAQKVIDIAKQKDKKAKQSEINIRKCSRRLEEIKRTVNLEDQPPLDEAVKKLDAIREDLLKVVFGK